MPTTTFITCAYSLTAVGAVPVATLAAQFAAIPVDLALPNMVGLLYDNDVTSTAGQTVTRTITLRARPSTDATATATLFSGDVSGSPIDALALGASGHDYAAPPVIGFDGTAENISAVAIALMGVDEVLVINGGSGYVAPTVTFVGGELPPSPIFAEGVLTPQSAQATGTVTIAGGVITAIVMTTRGGPYQVPPLAVITDTGGSGAILSPTLRVTGLSLLNPGAGYGDGAPTLSLTPFFASINPDSEPTSQIATVRSWMKGTFEAAMRMPIIAATPVIT
jgi:hypothetical protein